MVAERTDKDPAPAVTRAIRILEVLADAESGVPLSDLARAIGAAKSSTLNLCTVLERAGIITLADRRYSLGHRILEFGASYLRRYDEISTFYRFCAASSVLVHEIVQIVMLDGTDVVYLARHEGRAPLRLTANIGDRFPATLTAVGNALLADLDPAVVRRTFRGKDAFPQWTDRSVRDLAELQEKLAATRDRGYAIDDGGVHPGVYGLAVRVPPRSTASVPLAVGASLVAPNVTDEHRDGAVEELRMLARLLSNPLTNPAD